jgi:hypothetical protein
VTLVGSRLISPMWLAAYAFAVVMLGTTLPTPLYPHYEQRYGFWLPRRWRLSHSPS